MAAQQVLLAQPNPAHHAIAELATKFPKLTLITQNVDDLHERASSSDPLRPHGSLHHPHCFACKRGHEHPQGIPDEPEGGRRLEPPRCAHQRGTSIPSITLR